MAGFSRTVFIALGIAASAAPRVDARASISPSLVRVLASLSAGQTVEVWVDLRESALPRPAPQTLVCDRAWQRRLRRGNPSVDAGDQPLDPAAVTAVASHVTRLRDRSRWLRCLSAEATREQIEALANIACVRSIDCLRATERSRLSGAGIHAQRTKTVAEAVAKNAAKSVANVPPRPAAPPYDDSAAQLAMLHIPELHDRALSGLGVLIAHFDTGYERFSHQAFGALRVAAMHDFVDNDGDPTGANGFHFDTGEHGTITLSALGAFRPGTLIGAAFGASFALARTEQELVESATEEDHWIAALEWADSLGADIVSSSLKFRENDGGPGYTWQDMDGSTARVTQAAAMAERRGILIFNGAGNDGFDSTHNTLVAPADGVGVLAIGAVNLNGDRARFSSCGPTTDVLQRIKPDLMAPGVDVFAASTENDSAYALVSGTSLSCPLAAGVAALLLSVHDATPAQMRAVLRNTATRATTPDNEWGWGIIDALAAYRALVELFPSAAGETWTPVQGPRFANPFRPRDAIAFTLPGSSRFELAVYDVAGRRVRSLASGVALAAERRVAWDGTDDGGRALPRGVYVVELRGDPAATTRSTSVRKLTLWR